MKVIRLAIFGFLIGVAAVAGVHLIKTKYRKANVTDYQSCVTAGYPVGESYPEVCFAPNGSYPNPAHAAPQS